MNGEGPSKDRENKKTDAGLPGLEFSRLISLERSLHWDTAKKFWSEKKNELGCSYNRYSVIEKGTAKASLDLAKKIIGALKMPEDSGLYAWVRDLMPDEKNRSYFPEPNSFEKVSHTPLMFVDKYKLNLLNENEFAFQLFTYITMFTFRGVSEDELTKNFQMNKIELKSLLNHLLKQRMILRNPGGTYEVPDEAWIQLPNLPDFIELKTKTFRQNVESHFSSPYFSKTTFEIGRLRLFTQEQIDMIRDKANSLGSWAGTLPDEPGAKPFNFMLAANVATFGHARKNLFKQDRKIIDRSAWGDET